MRIVLEEGEIGRRRERVLRAENLTLANAEPGWRARALTGGTVANAYKYKAYTDAALIVRDPAGNEVVWLAHGVMSANKATTCGATRRFVPDGNWLFHGNTGAEKRRLAWKALKRAHRLALLRHTLEGNALEMLGLDLEGMPQDLLDGMIAQFLPEIAAQDAREAENANDDERSAA